MSNPPNEEQLRGIAAQLANLLGEAGVKMGHAMNDSNTGMVLRTIAALEVADGDRILELGHGNCTHLSALFNGSSDVHYHGLEISHTMHEASVALNCPFVDEGRAAFSLYDGSGLPFPDGHFTKLFTVNTLYFWPDPVAMLREMHRVLRPGGVACITFADRAFMAQLPFTRYGFTLYDPDDFTRLVEATAFGAPTYFSEREMVTSKDGQQLERLYHVSMMVV